MVKKQEGILVFLMMIAVAILGIGYAALTGSLRISGTASVLRTDTSLVVHFAGTPTGNAKSGTCASCSTTKLAIDSTDDTKADLDITGFKKVGDAYEAIFTVKNDSPDSGTTAYITATANMTGNNSNYFTITTDWGSTEQTIVQGSSKTLKVTVTLNQLYTGDDASISAGLSVQLAANTVSAGN